ncbi:hypothetical protein Pse7367_0418 [Thalassoporum mexicanum PCC 7367]|uniref:hypothetical protein n=1 Tax=Thalassoporum mexicanum TaxID=3457544 RepID=UPI00029F8259|nr:hypothetical protein [Pseudanabaena sp. PCC 7367]AFY68729.1 hypothetical protein Pse7367_0418 [Pseudanabaena sp. PCC 7367]
MSSSPVFSSNTSQRGSKSIAIPGTTKPQNSNSYTQRQQHSQKRYVPIFLAERDQQAEHSRCNIHFGMVRYCRIKKRHGDRPLRAIEYNHKYYSFFKLAHSWMDAEAIAIKLDGDFVITVMTQGWAIWLYRQ